MSQTICRHLSIHGRVQGVGFRWSLCGEARMLGLSGWVCNRHDGSVEALISGNVEAVETLTRWAHRGPEAARVDKVIVTAHDDDATGMTGGFEQRPTY